MSDELPKCKHGIIAKACADCVEISRLRAESAAWNKRAVVAEAELAAARVKLESAHRQIDRLQTVPRVPRIQGEEGK